MLANNFWPSLVLYNQNIVQHIDIFVMILGNSKVGTTSLLLWYGEKSWSQLLC